MLCPGCLLTAMSCWAEWQSTMDGYRICILKTVRELLQSHGGMLGVCCCQDPSGQRVPCNALCAK